MQKQRQVQRRSNTRCYQYTRGVAPHAAAVPAGPGEAGVVEKRRGEQRHYREEEDEQDGGRGDGRGGGEPRDQAPAPPVERHSQRAPVHSDQLHRGGETGSASEITDGGIAASSSSYSTAGDATGNPPLRAATSRVRRSGEGQEVTLMAIYIDRRPGLGTTGLIRLDPQQDAARR